MGDQVGKSGYILGVDKNAEFINSLAKPHVDVREGMIQEMEFKERFDLIHARYFFIHNTNTKALLTQVSGLLKPGGVLVLEEPDFTIARWIDKNYAAFGNRVNRAICTMFNNMGLNPAYGAEVALELTGCGLTLTHIEAHMHLDIGGSGVAQVMAKSTKVLKEKYVNTGEADETDIAQYIEGANDPDSLAIYYSTVSIIGKRAL
jgi:2-polyprenyl-3-methyl-5-hydroxy-6-metoxy-1,4-benzoquinol methylase